MDEISNNIPSDGVVERMHIIHYPNGGGKISKHVDPIKFANAILEYTVLSMELIMIKGDFLLKILADRKLKLIKELRLET